VERCRKKRCIELGRGKLPAATACRSSKAPSSITHPLVRHQICLGRATHMVARPWRMVSV
jgi:hypothetical protein